jgi:hypothetical protein
VNGRGSLAVNAAGSRDLSFLSRNLQACPIFVKDNLWTLYRVAM